MVVRHLDCATMCPFGGRALIGSGGLLKGELVAHCLLIETGDGLVLVDSGIGTGDIAEPSRLGISSTLLVRPALRLEQTALHQIRALGYQPSDVRHLVLTHLDFDHAGGIGDFPDATVHVLADELAAVSNRGTLLQKARFRPQQWAHGPKWQTHQPGSESWFDFTAIPLFDDIVLVPLIGHTEGHTGVAVRQDDGWLLHCGDAYLHRSELRGGRLPVGLAVHQRLTDTIRRTRVHNLERLRALRADHGAQVRLFCAHDEQEFAELHTANTQ
ncbi:MBL fold metallo-hydrolase [Nocardia sp. NPDC049149]|uniref:MBL fold metallo-hydrolase n=1 Tax=Nocardia sp. NPDC049149 TaxID=3364315 RepID=UPI00371D299F